jgi:hypothetical protein
VKIIMLSHRATNSAKGSTSTPFNRSPASSSVRTRSGAPSRAYHTRSPAPLYVRPTPRISCEARTTAPSFTMFLADHDAPTRLQPRLVSCIRLFGGTIISLGRKGVVRRNGQADWYRTAVECGGAKLGVLDVCEGASAPRRTWRTEPGLP